MLTSVDPRAPTALLTSLTEPFSACFLVSSTVLRDLGMTGFWAMEFLGLSYGLRPRFPANRRATTFNASGKAAQTALA
jgi:hypothetical protein